MEQMYERLEAKKREANDLRDKERASEMTIRRLEEEVKLLRKQHNDIDKAWRRGDDKGGVRAATPKESVGREGAAANRPPFDMQRVESSGSEVLSLKKQLAAAEAELSEMRSKLDLLNKECDRCPPPSLPLSQ